MPLKYVLTRLASSASLSCEKPRSLRNYETFRPKAASVSSLLGFGRITAKRKYRPARGLTARAVFVVWLSSATASLPLPLPEGGESLSLITLFQAAVATALGRMMVSAKRSISSSCGLHCSKSKSTPAASNSAMRSATCSGVPIKPERKPRLETE
jgi:hypothetical protein